MKKVDKDLITITEETIIGNHILEVGDKIKIIEGDVFGLILTKDLIEVIKEVEKMKWDDIKKIVLSSGMYNREVFDMKPLNQFSKNIECTVKPNHIDFNIPFEWENKEEGEGKYYSNMIISYHVGEKKFTGDYAGVMYDRL